MKGTIFLSKLSQGKNQNHITNNTFGVIHLMYVNWYLLNNDFLPIISLNMQTQVF